MYFGQCPNCTKFIHFSKLARQVLAFLLNGYFEIFSKRLDRRFEFTHENFVSNFWPMAEIWKWLYKKFYVEIIAKFPKKKLRW
jgi:hypothetical protein